MKVYPAPGLQVRDPETKQLIPQEGIDVDDGSLFYSRRLRDGDVVLAPTKAVPTVILAAPLPAQGDK